MPKKAAAAPKAAEAPKDSAAAKAAEAPRASDVLAVKDLPQQPVTKDPKVAEKEKIVEEKKNVEDAKKDDKAASPSGKSKPSPPSKPQKDANVTPTPAAPAEDLAAAAEIQAAAKGHLTRKSLIDSNNHSAGELQAAAKGHLARKAMMENKPNKNEVGRLILEPDTNPLDVETILFPEADKADPMDAMLAEIANEAVNSVVSSVITLIQKGELQQHRPAKAWGGNTQDTDARQRVLAQKRYNRIQRLLIQAENGQVDAQKELLKINQQLDRDHLSGVSAEDIILEDLAALIKAKEDRQKELEFKKQLKEQKKKEKKMKQKRQQQIRAMQDEQMQRMRELEVKFQERIQVDEEEKKKQKELKEAEKRKEEEMRRQISKEVGKRLGNVPLYKKMERQFTDKVVVPELQRRKEYLAQIRNDMRNPHYLEIAQHESKIRAWETAERGRLDEKKIPIQTLPVKQTGKIAEEIKKQDADRRVAHQAQKEARMQKLVIKQEYGKKVLEDHKPKVDPDKVAQMELMAMDVDKERAKAMRQRGDELLKNNAGEYLKKGFVAAVGENPDPEKLEKQKRKRKKEMETPPPEKPIDYLQDLKAQRKPNQKKRIIVKSLNPDQLVDLAKAKERKAAECEQRLIDGSGNDDVESAAEVSELYIDVIKTKMELLAR